MRDRSPADAVWLIGPSYVNIATKKGQRKKQMTWFPSSARQYSSPAHQGMPEALLSLSGDLSSQLPGYKQIKEVEMWAVVTSEKARGLELSFHQYRWQESLLFSVSMYPPLTPASSLPIDSLRDYYGLFPEHIDSLEIKLLTWGRTRKWEILFQEEAADLFESVWPATLPRLSCMFSWQSSSGDLGCWFCLAEKDVTSVATPLPPTCASDSL